MHAPKRVRLLSLFAVLVLPHSVTLSQAELPLTSAGKQVAGYIAAFNAGETEMGTFIRNHWSVRALETLPPEQRLTRYREIRQALGTIQLYRVLQATESTLTAIVRSANEAWMEFRFGFDDTPEQALMWVSIQQTDDPDQAPVHPAPSVKAAVERTASYLDSLTTLDRFSGVVLIARGDSVLFARAYGYANREKKIPNQIDTRFNIGSINKTFTRIAILQLESRGVLSRADTIGRFLPDYPNAEAARSVTIQHLLTMSSGIGDIFGTSFEAADKEKILTLQDYLPLFADKPLEFPPGTGRRYSNGGYIVLGLIVERASGVDYYDYVRQNVYASAGMSSSDWFRKSSLPANVALGYSTPERVSNYPTLPGKGSSAGGGYSTAEDLFQFVRALRAGLFTLPDTKNGMRIAGGAPGLTAALEWDPGQDSVIIVLCNFDPPLAVRVADSIRKSMPER